MIISCSRQRFFTAFAALLVCSISSLGITLSSCSNQTESAKSGEAKPTALPGEKTSIFTARTNWAGTYEGTLGERNTVRLRLNIGSGDSTLIGSYYYCRQGYLLDVRGQCAGDSLTLLEYAQGNTKPATALFRLVRLGPRTLSGVWQTSRSQRPLAVRLTCYDGAKPAPNLVASIRYRTELGEFPVPVVTVPDAGVTRLLRHEQFTVEQVTGLARAELQAVVTAHQRGESGGYDGPRDYVASYNANGLLSLRWYDEMVGANVTGSTSYLTLDLRTGYPLRVAEEIAPTRRPQFVALCNQLLRRQIQAYVDSATQSSPAEAVNDTNTWTDLRSQQMTQEVLTNSDLVLQSTGIRLPYSVRYEGLSSFETKNLRDVFYVQLPFDLLQPYLLPDSPLQRLKQR